MKVYVEGVELADAVSKVGKAMPVKKAANSILEGIKLKAEGDQLTITATDLELAIEKKIEATVKIEGETVVNGKFFIEYVGKVKDEAVELDAVSEEKVVIKYPDGEGSVAAMPIDEYPPIKNVDEVISFNISQNELRDIINKIAFCAAQEDTRPVLKGCCLDLSKDTLTGVASDGYRMALCKKTIDFKGEGRRIIVPARSLNEISKQLEESDEEVKVNIERNHLMVVIGSTRIVTRLIDNEYINYNKIIPVDFTTEVIVDKKALERSLDRASIVTKADKKSIVKMDIKEKSLNINAKSEESSNNENLEVNLTGKDLVIGFNAKYIIDSLRAINDSFVKLKFNTSTAPGIIVPTDSDEYLYLILPIRILS